jgi:uncharacterized alkaline shock family protein YloU
VAEAGASAEAAGSFAGSPTGPADPGERGELIIRSRAVSRVAEHAVLDVPGVVRSSSSRLGPITRRELPRAVVDMTTAHPNVRVDVALAWPSPVAALCRAMRGRVNDEVARMVGRQPSRVDISVTALIADGSTTEVTGERR